MDCGSCSEEIVDMVEAHCRHYGEELHMVRCKPDNIKITTPVDYFLFKGIVEASENYNVFGL